MKDTGAAYHSDCRKDIKSLHELCVQVSLEWKQKYSLWLDLKIYSAENKTQLRVRLSNFLLGGGVLGLSSFGHWDLASNLSSADCSALHVHMKLIVLEIVCLSNLLHMYHHMIRHMYRHMVIDLCSFGMTVVFRELPLKVSHSYIWALSPCLCFIFE